VLAHPHGEVSVVIPTWNGLDMLEVLLPSLERQTFGDFSVVVVDNGSTDGTPKHLAERWPRVHVLALPENAGFAPAVNLGIAAGEAPRVALLNNDLELDPGWMDAMVRALHAHPGAGSATGRMLAFHDRDLIDDAGNGFSWYGVGFARGKREPDDGRYREPEAVFAACGGAALYRRAALDDVGLFDEDFFAYAEDLDWGFRAQLAGWACRYVPDAVSYHIGAGTSARAGDLSRYLTFRNSLWLVLKGFPRTALLRHGHRLALFVLGTAAQAIARRETAELRALRDALRGAPRMLRKRRAIQRRRRAGPAELDAVVQQRFPTDVPAFRFVDDRIVRSQPASRA
jgi:GT2 family glycosyltransferase